MWKDSIRNIVVIFQPNILRSVGFYVRHSAIVYSHVSSKSKKKGVVIMVWSIVILLQLTNKEDDLWFSFQNSTVLLLK